MSWGLAKRMLVLGAALLLLCVRTEAADRQIRPFAGATFGGTTPFVDFEDAASKLHPAIGVDAVFLGEMFGVDIDVADVPGFMEADNQLVVHSRVTTLCGNVVIAAPRRLAEYSLRPYVVAGGGLMRARRITSFNVFDVSSVTPGGGVRDQQDRRRLGRPPVSEFQRQQRADGGSRRSSLVLARDDGCSVPVLTCAY